MSKTKKSNTKKSKTMKNNSNPKKEKCDKDYTYGSVVSGYYTILDGLSNATINKSKKLNNRVKIYKKDMYRTYDCMVKLYKKVKDEDKKEDLRIMLDNLKIIIKQVEQGFKL
uniref:Uncharacterized protein n=1 Tax=viral metagenome TaxID=1070528 RepID=A0A6C0JK96_9ZZZZ